MPDHPLAKRLHVLVVDDDASVRDVLVEYFRTQGFDVEGAGDGRGAIALLNRSPSRFDLVLTDLNLPGADGFAVLQTARQANPMCFVVIVTGFASLSSAIQAVRVGAYDYLTKPFSLSQLESILARIQETTDLAVAAMPPGMRPVVAMPQGGRPVAAMPQGERPVAAPPSGSPDALRGPEARLAAIETAIARLSEQLATMAVGVRR